MGGRFYNNKEELSPTLKMCQMRGCLNENVSKRALFPPTKLITLIFFINSNVKIPYNIRIYVKTKL